ncbi:MAG: hypothetical protein N3A38_07580, partial [Planctomycetota bacterium]|nr:hypothetical protein [Planctomycetota bacterium]
MILYVATKEPDVVFAACEAQGDVMDREAGISPKRLLDDRFVLALCVSRLPELPEGAEILGEKWREIPSDIQTAAGLVAVRRAPDEKAAQSIAKAADPAAKLAAIEAAKCQALLVAEPGPLDVPVACGQRWVEFQGVRDGEDGGGEEEAADAWLR